MSSQNRGSAVVLIVLAVVAVVGGIAIGAAGIAPWAPLAGVLPALLLAGAAVHRLRTGDDRRRAPGATAPRPGAGPADPPEPGGTSVRSVDAFPLARTPAEAHLAVSMSPCSCGASGVVEEFALVDIDGTSVGRYSGTCRCGKHREFLYRLPRDPLVFPPDEFHFGDGGPSQLLDPGVWLAVADHYARLAPASVAGLDETARRTALHNMMRAAAAMDEVIAFIPAGAEMVAPGAFTSPTGRRVRDREPGRFRRIRLEVVRDTYREIVAEMADPPAGATR